MKTLPIKIVFGLLGFGLAGLPLLTFGVDDPIEPALQAKLDVQAKIVRAWAADPVIVNAVKAQNASLPAEYAAMTQEKWKSMSRLDPFVRSFDKSAAGEFLKSKKSDVVIRAFLSDAAGLKVGFTAKTMNWSHKGEPKHEIPMTGKSWQGPREQDRVTGWEQILISVPVLDGDKPIGSLVVSLSTTKL